MLNQLAEYFTRLFAAQTTYGSELEQYIVSKGPQSVAEIDYWTKQFDNIRNRGGWL